MDDPSENDFPNQQGTIIVRNSIRIPLNTHDGTVVIDSTNRNQYKECIL